MMMQLIYADDTSLNAWRRDDLTSAVAIFSQETQDADYHRLANLALVRARLEQWESAEQDARASIEIRPTILAFIAVSIALGGQGQLAAAKQEFNQAFLCHEPKNACLLLLIKSIIIFVAGDRNEATRRVGDLVQACERADEPLCRAVQAQMQFLVGQTALDEKDSEEALNLFASAGASAPFLKLPELDTITLIFGWDFDSLLLGIRQRTCEALYVASRMSEATQSLQALLDEFGAEIRASVKLSDWLQNFAITCAQALQTAGDTSMTNVEHEEAIPFEQPAYIHWLLLPYDPQRSRRLLRFDIAFPDVVFQDRGVRTKLSDAELEKPAANGTMTKMLITFEHGPFSWEIDVKNSTGIRCRDVFEAIYKAFNEQLTLEEQRLVRARQAVEFAFRLRCKLSPILPEVERSQGWKRVDVLLHRTIFLGLTQPKSGGDWILNIGSFPRVPDLS